MCFPSKILTCIALKSPERAHRVCAVHARGRQPALPRGSTAAVKGIDVQGIERCVLPTAGFSASSRDVVTTR